MLGEARYVALEFLEGNIDLAWYGLVDCDFLEILIACQTNVDIYIPVHYNLIEIF